MNEKGLSALDYCDMFRFADLGQYLVLQGAESGKCDAEGTPDMPAPWAADVRLMSTAELKSFR